MSLKTRFDVYSLLAILKSDIKEIYAIMAYSQTLCASPKEMTTNLSRQDRQIISETNFLRLSNEFYWAMRLVAVVMLLLTLASPFMRMTNKSSEKLTVPTSVSEYFNENNRTKIFATLLVSSPFLLIVLLNKLTKTIELSSGTKRRKRLTVKFKTGNKKVRLIAFSPFQIVIYKRHGGLVNLKVGDTVDMDVTTMGRMISYKMRDDWASAQQSL